MTVDEEALSAEPTPNEPQSYVKSEFPLVDMMIEMNRYYLSVDRRRTVSEVLIMLIITRHVYRSTVDDSPCYIKTQQIVDQTDLPYQTVVRICNEFARNGQVQKFEDPDDARQTVYFPTDVQFDMQSARATEFTHRWTEKLASHRYTPEQRANFQNKFKEKVERDRATYFGNPPT